MIQLPPTFTFSQSSLQAFADCPRRFWLAYVEQLPWPAVEASPVHKHEEQMRLGERFHRLVQRTEIGIDPVDVGAELAPPLTTWFAAYQRHRPADLPTDSLEVERVLAIPFGLDDTLLAPQPVPGVPHSAFHIPHSTFRLAAKYDLIAAERDGRVVILDWKTARRRSDPASLRQRLQTVVYPYVLVEASAQLPWGPVRPEQVEMRYWFTAAPDQPVTFRYDGAQHDRNRAQLHRLLREILTGADEAAFPKVTDTEVNRKRLCAYCIYRSRCGRGEAAGDLELLDDTDDIPGLDVEKALAFTLDDLPELAF